MIESRAGRNAAVVVIASTLFWMNVVQVEAQRAGFLAGTVADSIRGGGLANALVSIRGSEVRARTDSLGNFSLGRMLPGRYSLQVRSPFLDSLRLGVVEREFELPADSSHVVISTPSLGSYQRAVCGAELRSHEAVLIGNVTEETGDPASGNVVAALWHEIQLSSSGAERLLRGTIDTTDAGGWYTLCGLPLDGDFQVRAGEESSSTEVLDLSAHGRPVGRRDLRVGSRERSVRVAGRMTSAAGASISGSVEVVGDSSRRLRVDTSGTFALTLSPRSTQLRLRSVGFAPTLVDVEPFPPETDLGDVVLVALPQELPERVIVDRARTLAELEFEERRNSGAGVQLDSATLAKYPRVGSTALANETRLVRSEARGGAGEIVMLRQGVGSCFPRVYVDGRYFGSQGGRGGRPSIDGALMAQLLREAKRIEIYSATYAPAAYPDLDGCGVVLLWTR